MRADATLMTPAMQRLMEAVISSGQIRRQEYFQLTSTLLAQPSLMDNPPVQISNIFDQVVSGQCQLID